MDEGMGTTGGTPDLGRSRRAVAALDRFQRRRAWAAFPYAVVKKYGDDQGGYLATLIAYYGFFSVFPLMLVFVTVLGIVLANSPELQQDIIESALARFPIVGPTIAEEVHAISGNALALVIGAGTALWAGLRVLQATQNAMSRVWGVAAADRPGWVASRVRSVLFVLVLGAAIVVSTFLTGLATAAGDAGAVRVGQLAISLAFNLVVFLLAYRVLSPISLRWRDVAPGAVAAAALWTLLQGIGGLFVSHTIRNASNVYGTFALVIGLLVWIHLGAQVAVGCAEIDVVRLRRLWPRGVMAPPTDADRRALDPVSLDP